MFSVVLSFVIVPLLGLMVNYSPSGMTRTAVLLVLTAFDLSVALVAYWRRSILPAENRLSAAIPLQWPVWHDYTPLEKALTVALSVSLVIVIGTLAYTATAPRPAEPSTQFYILGPRNSASGYPTALNVSQNGSVIIGIANHEAATANYTVRVDLVGVRIVYNATTGFNETVEVNRTTRSSFPVTLADGRNWTQPYTFSIAYVGVWKVQFLLFKDGDFSSAYRELHLYVRVT